MKTKNGSALWAFSVLILWTGHPIPCHGQPGCAGLQPAFPVRGYIITHEGDTIPGIIRSEKITEMCLSSILFRGPGIEPRSFSAGELSGMGLEHDPSEINLVTGDETYFWEHYETRFSGEKQKPVFLNRLDKGTITVFQDLTRGGNFQARLKGLSDGHDYRFLDHSYLVILDTVYVSVDELERICCYKRYLVEKEGLPLTTVTGKNKESLYPVLFGDCPELQEEVLRNPELNEFRNFMILAILYNRICKEETKQIPAP